jgi:CDP-diacylglycerol--glycerol-3-phosphate 3-phosphatidyltransferase
VDRASEPPPQGGPPPAAGADDEASRGFDRIQRRYIDGVRRAAANSVGRLARTGITPNMLTVAGVSISALGAIAVYFEYRDELLAFWVGAALFIAGAVLDILDGALARTTGRAGPYGAFVDSTTDRLGEAFMLGAIALVLMREGNEIAVAAAFAALTGSLLVSYTRARAEALGLRGNVGIGSRAERVVVISAGLILAPWLSLQWAIYLLTATSWITVLQRALSVRSQLRERGDL